MRALIMLLAILLLEGCIATERLQRDTIKLAQSADQQCRESLVRIEELITAQENTTKAIEREAESREALILTRKTAPPDCPKIRESLRNKTIVGAVEWAVIDLGNEQLIAKARMDTGAATSSLGATDIAEFERNGKRWVRFKLADGRTISQRLERFVNIRQAAASESNKRPVVKLGVKIGEIAYIGEFTLADRSHLKYEVLIGRNVLRDLMVVDVARLYVQGSKPQSAKPDNGKQALRQ
ncbi:RimK/LysX family protein [Pontibacterium granulatum]|uniref:ATP-dependent zinc protease family protein n=1 Tax=Pontibacterium granulatum TaxID=2036029 RepID=UPI00249CB4A9|nr:RimK/LysX family protein [Pontibacterium granulatum]MDI3325557.1 RimK/LysX family protein [Pontibacterium granulatum]